MIFASLGIFTPSEARFSAYADVFNMLNFNSNPQESALTGPALLLRVPLSVEAPRYPAARREMGLLIAEFLPYLASRQGSLIIQARSCPEPMACPGSLLSFC